MFVKRIQSIIPPPENLSKKCEPGAINKMIGFALPNDYYELIEVYGAGTFGKFINILVPYVNEYEFSLFGFMETDRQIYIENQDFIHSFEENENDPRLLDGWKIGEPYNYYPDKDGLIPWGKYPEGNEYTFYWKTSAEKWTIVVYDDLFGYKEYDMSMTEFLYYFLVGNIVVDDSFDTNSISFVPFH